MNFNWNGHVIEFDYEIYLQYFWVGILFVIACRVLQYFLLNSLRNDYSHKDNLNRTTREIKLLGVVVSTLFWSVAAAFMAVALAEPYEANQPIEVPAGSIHAVFGYDVSPSCDAEDYRDSLPTPKLSDGRPSVPIGPWGSRLQVARWITVNQIMKQMPGNKIALVAYTADGRAVSLLREDYSVVRDLLNDDETLTAPGGGSDPADGLKAAVSILRKQYDPKKRQMIFLFTDGGISDLEEKTSAEDKEVWERDFQRTLNDLDGLRRQAEQEGVAPPLVVLVGVGGDQEVMVPLYYTNNERVRNERGEPEFFPLNAEADKKEKTRLIESNILMLKSRIEAVVPCKYVRISQNWSDVENLNWVENVIGGEKGAIGKQYLTAYPLYAAMALIVLLLARGMLRSDVIVRRQGSSS